MATLRLVELYPHLVAAGHSVASIAVVRVTTFDDVFAGRFLMLLAECLFEPVLVHDLASLAEDAADTAKEVKDVDKGGDHDPTIFLWKRVRNKILTGHYYYNFYAF